MADNGKNGAMRIDTKLVRELSKLLDEGNLTEIEVEDGDRKIKVARGGAPVAYAAAAPALAASVPVAAASSASAGDVDAAALAEGSVVKSPMVGTVYLSPEPGAKQFAAVGEPVKAGDTLMIIEAMKVMNSITAPSAGILSQLLVGDSQPVEFDQPLAVIA